MRNITAIGDKVLATMVDGFGEKVTKGGVILQEKDATSEAIRPRWFHVTHVGPDQEDVKVGDYVLVYHGRWTRGITLSGYDTKIYMLDPEYLMATSDKMPEAVV